MYDETIKRLWECASGECFNCSQYTPTTNASICQKELMKQAADAIEELQKRVPKRPHGRLIDAEALKAKQQEDADLFINAYTLMEKTRRDEALNAVANIVNAPTIIPAEEESGE